MSTEDLNHRDLLAGSKARPYWSREPLREGALKVLARAVVGVVALLLTAPGWAGCTGESEGRSGPHRSTQPSAAPSAESPSAPETAPTPTSSANPLATTPLPKPYRRVGAVAGVVRADDGTAFVAFGSAWPDDRTSFRLYDRNWRPLTPLLRLDVALMPERGTAHGFVGRATRTNRNGRTTFAKWVTLNRAGRVQRVAKQPERSMTARPPRPGDLHLEGTGQRGSLAYRPATDTVFKKPRPPWDTVGHSWYVDLDGTICAMSSGPLAERSIHVSLDEGRTYTTISVADVIPASSGPRLQSCDTTSERIVIGTGGENPRWLHTLDRTGRQLRSSRRLGDLLNPYGWGMLPDGRLVTGTNRPGLMVATDNTNTQMDYRPGPIPVNFGFEIIDDLLVSLRGRGLDVSNDAGLTWQHIELLPSTSAGAERPR